MVKTMVRSQNLSDDNNGNIIQDLVQEEFLEIGLRKFENTFIPSIQFNLASFRYSSNVDFNKPSNIFKILIKN